jgi:predicted nucleotide-binding protein (sugar kinase/HSP70/actin superfamily)
MKRDELIKAQSRLEEEIKARNAKSKTKLITLRVTSKQADEVLRNHYLNSPIERQLVRNVRGEFTGLVDILTMQRRAESILRRRKDAMLADIKATIDEQEDPICKEIRRLEELRSEIRQKNEAILDRAVNQALRKAGITEFYSFGGYIREVSRITNGNWQYGNTAIYGQ